MVKFSRTSGRGSDTYRHIPRITLVYFLATFVMCVTSFFLGVIYNLRKVIPLNYQDSPLRPIGYNSHYNFHLRRDDPRIVDIVEQRVEAELSKAGASDLNIGRTPDTLRFDSKVAGYAQGMARVQKDDFLTKFDYGPPMDKGFGSKTSDVLLLYNTVGSTPTHPDTAHVVRYDIAGGTGIPSLDVDDATENCHTMNVLSTNNPGNTQQCLAIVGNYESYHLQRWMRVNSKGGAIDGNLPLRAVSRGYGSQGTQSFRVPGENSMRKHQEMFQTYLNTVDDVMKELRPVAEKVAVENTIIVMTCNMGQSELLMNFVCHAHARGLNLGNVLFFPTDRETMELAEGMGLTTFYDERNFGKLPSGEAKRYGDRNFVAMMFAKVLVVHLVNILGYDLLFQDVDVVWYKNPLTFFHNKSNEYVDFDIYFQDDGAHSSRYAPLSANSGFYYARYNQRTRYLFASLLYAGDIIIESDSHQQVLIQLMNEHSSLFGLRVKVFSRDTDEFPGGFHYHRRKDLMKKIVMGEVEPYIFHMSWTHNKDNKLKFFQQMGEWHLEDKCIGNNRTEIGLNNKTRGSEKEENVGASNMMPLVMPCCLVKPNITCHYRDKPSKVPCKESDPIDKGRPSFW